MIVILAVDDEERPVPARAIGKVPDDVPQFLEPLFRRAVGGRRRAAKRPIDHERASFDQRARHCSPITRITRSIAVVTHREILIRLDDEWLVLITRSIRDRKSTR